MVSKLAKAIAKEKKRKKNCPAPTTYCWNLFSV
jgi:hypothetical protein